MTEGDRPTPDSVPGSYVSDDTDVYPIDFAPPIPPARAVTPAPPQQPASTPPGNQYPNAMHGQPGYPPPGYQPPQGYAPQAYPGYQGSAGYPGYPSYERGGTGRGLKVFLVLLFVLLIGLVGLIFGLATGILRYNDLARLVGMGPGEIYVQNLRDDSVTVTIQHLDAGGDASAPAHEDEIGPADVRAYPERATGAWDVHFAAADGTDLGTCQLTVSGNGRYTFMVLPDIVVVSSAGQAMSGGDDFVVQAAPLCRRS